MATQETAPELESRVAATPQVMGLLWVHPREAFVAFAMDTILFGRGADAGFVLASESVSRSHASIRRVGPVYRLSDAGSRNGTFHNGRAVQDATLALNDVVRLGDWVGVVTEVDAAIASSGPYFEEAGTGVIVGPRSAALFRRLEEAAAERAPIVIEGPTGTGKEVMARAIHQRSGRAGAFVGVNCAALPEALVEAQLFGHARGAFTGATQASEGLIATANGGTLLLDEIVDLPASQQAKLLRVIEEASVLRVGESVPRAIDVRFLAASQRPLWQLVQQGAFRADLLGRLSGCTLRLLPLCERREEIPRLFFGAFSAAKGDPTRLKSSAVEALCLAPWPLNIRQLVQVARNAASLQGGHGEIGRQLLAPLLDDATPPESDEASLPASPDRSTPPDRGEELVLGKRRAQWLARHQHELDELQRALPKTRGNVSAAARLVGLSRSAALRLLEAAAELKQDDVERP